jgi:hypothetical protein
MPSMSAPVGVEPTLGTLLGGRPLPLGYGGGFIIPPVQLPNRRVAKTSGNLSLTPAIITTHHPPFLAYKCRV